MNRRNQFWVALSALVIVGLSCTESLNKEKVDIEPNTCSPHIVIQQDAPGAAAGDFKTQIENVGSGTAKNLIVALDFYEVHDERLYQRAPCTLSTFGQLGPGMTAEVNCEVRTDFSRNLEDYILRYIIQCERYEVGETSLAGTANVPLEGDTETGENSDLPDGELVFNCMPLKGYLIRLTEPGPSPPAHTVDSAEMAYTIILSQANRSIEAKYSSEIQITWPRERQDSITREWSTWYSQERHARTGSSLDFELFDTHWFSLTTEDVTNVSSNETGSWEANPPVENIRHLIGYYDLENQEIALCDNWGTVPEVAAWRQGGPENFNNNCLVDLYTCSRSD